MDQKIIDFNKSQQHKKFPKVKIGDVVRVYRTIKEGEKSRVQFFEGLVIAIKGKQSSSPTITVRKVTKGIGVEMIFPIFSPVITKIEIIRHSKVRRSKLYYMRERFGKAAKMKTIDPTEEELNFYSQSKKESEKTEGKDIAKKEKEIKTKKVAKDENKATTDKKEVNKKNIKNSNDKKDTA